MTTLFDYLSWRGDLPLSADPFHEVDGVILARFTYMPFHRVLRRDSLTPTTVEAVCRALLALPDIETAVRRRGDYLSGSIRLLDALLIAGSIAGGVVLGWIMARGLGVA